MTSNNSSDVQTVDVIAYDADGRIAFVTHNPGGADEREWAYTYHPTDGHLASVTSPLAAADALAGTTTYVSRDGAWRPTAVTLPGGDEVGFGYDGNGNVTGVTPPGSDTHGFGFTDWNLTERYAPPTLGADEHAVTSYGYRLDRKLDTVLHDVYAAGVSSGDPGAVPLRTDTAVDRIYNAEGRLSGAAVLSGHGAGRTTYSYAYSYRYESPSPSDPGGVQVKTIDVTDAGAAEGLRLTYGYDGFLLVSTAWGEVPGLPGAGTGVSGAVSQQYNADYQVVSRTVSAGGDVSTIDFGHDHDLTVHADGLLTSAVHATAGGITLTRDPGHGLVTATSTTATSSGGGPSVDTDRVISGFGESDRLTASFVGAVTEDLFDEHVTERDAIGRIVRETETVLGVPRDYFYKYDPSGRLLYVCEETAGPLCSGDVPPDPADQVIEQYSYGVNGNRASAFVA
ncbi:MAG: hypothetical protein ABI333_22340, partial [bacterium]